MKIRTGFVSNSSSSSFCIVGILAENLDIDDVESFAEQNGSSYYAKEEIVKDYNRGGVAWLDLDLEGEYYSTVSGIDEYYDEGFFGINIDYFEYHPDKTFNDVKKLLVDELVETGFVFDPDKVAIFNDGGRDC